MTDDTNLPDEESQDHQGERLLRARASSAHKRLQDRGPMRGPMRSSQRVQRGPLTRRRTRVNDPFRIDGKLIPEGVSYEWKRKSCYGQPDTQHQLDLRENHWNPVPSNRHPEMMPEGTSGTAPIEKNGMILMERPAYLTWDARQEDLEIALQEVGVAEAQMAAAPPDHFERNHPSARRVTGVNRNFNLALQGIEE